MLYDDDHIYGSPYEIKVYDPSQVKVFGLEGGTVGTGLTFNGNVHTFIQWLGSYFKFFGRKHNSQLKLLSRLVTKPTY